MPTNLRPLAMLLCLVLCGCTPPPPSRSAPRSSEPGYQGERSTSARDRRAEDRRSEYPRSEDRRSPRTSDDRTGFDFYLLNLSWSPEFCATHPNMPECARHLGFVLHGLWPQNSDGSYPQHCSEDPPPADPAQFSDLYPDAGLLRHEWQTHGTCSGLAPEQFFTTARRAVESIHIPQQLTSLDHQVSMPPDAILGLFTAANPTLPRESLALSCGNNYLTAVEVCLSKDLRPIACQQVRSCRANTVRIPPPGQQ